MLCLFCRRLSDASRSVEHVVPESLGNSTHTLPAGVVCDACNNYFAREVEKPFLELPLVRRLRFEQRVPSKKGRVPGMSGTLGPGLTATFHAEGLGRSGGSLEVSDDGVRYLLSGGRGVLRIPFAVALPKGPILSRFLAKVALEALTLRLAGDDPEQAAIAWLAGEPQFDPIRDHARRGATFDWPVHVRPIYDADARWTDADGRAYEVLHEYDVLRTDADEYYFVLALFGLELVINYGAPQLDGFVAWIRANGGASPLYTGRNADGCGGAPPP